MGDRHESLSAFQETVKQIARYSDHDLMMQYRDASSDGQTVFPAGHSERTTGA